MNPNEDKHQVQRLIKRLKSEIYPQIDRFISNAEIVLAEQFNIPYETFALEEAELKFAAERDTLGAEVRVRSTHTHAHGHTPKGGLTDRCGGRVPWL